MKGKIWPRIEEIMIEEIIIKIIIIITWIEKSHC
jgi:hypothetical protein